MPAQIDKSLTAYIHNPSFQLITNSFQCGKQNIIPKRFNDAKVCLDFDLLKISCIKNLKNWTGYREYACLNE